MTTETEQHEQDEVRRKYLDFRPRAILHLPGPGKRPDERERLAELAKARTAAAEAAKAERQGRAAQAREDAKAQYQVLVAYRAQVAETLGRAKFDLERATEGHDIAAALEAAGRLVALQAAEDALKKHEVRLTQASLGKFGPIPGAERV